MNASRKRRPRSKSREAARPRRRASVLIIVLVVIVLLTYGVYGFTERMLAEAEAADAHGRAAQATAFAESGVELAASWVTARAADPENPESLYHRPDLFGGVIMRQSPTPSAVGRFSLVAPVEGDSGYRQVRFGLEDESGKLNLNAMMKLELEPLDQQNMLMYLPLMTEEIADAILDYIDEDEEQRTFGAESDYYQTLAPPYDAKNGPLESIDELLLVRGVTPELLYGEDANRNGLLDPAEDDGPATPPIDDGDGALHPGWIAFLTIHSRESNSRPPAESSDTEGEPKININLGILADLYDTIEPELGEDAARFIAAYRMYGPTDPDPAEPEPSVPDNQTPDSGQQPTQPGNQQPNQGTPTQDPTQDLDNLAKNVANMISNAGEGGSVTRGGLDLSKPAEFEIKSLYELFDRVVKVPADEEKGTVAEEITSPWSSGNIVEQYPLLFELFATTENAYIEARVNVNEARREVLLGLPNMTPELVDAIIAARQSGAGPVALDPEKQTTAWLVARGIVDGPTMRTKLDSYLTGRGDVFKVQSVGFFDGGGPSARIEAVIDGTVSPAKIVFFRDLSDLGRGYVPQQLLPAGGTALP